MTDVYVDTIKPILKSEPLNNQPKFRVETVTDDTLEPHKLERHHVKKIGHFIPIIIKNKTLNNIFNLLVKVRYSNIVDITRILSCSV